MVKFDSDDPGTSAAVWRADARLAALASLTVPAGPLVVLAAHPDDETLGAGGLIAAARRAGVDVTVVVATDGGAGGDAADRDALVARRASELGAALRTLGVDRPAEFLRAPDGGLREHREAVRATVAAIVARISRRDGEERGGARPLVVAPWTGDGHRDHRVLGEIAVEVARAAGAGLWQYPIWMWHWGEPQMAEIPWPALAAFPLDDAERTAKAQALRAFVSQTTAHGGRPPLLHSRFLEHFAAESETFVVSL